MNPSNTRVAVLLALCLAAGIGLAQPYVEDSIDVGGYWVGSMCYNSRANAIYGASEQPGIFFTIDCATNQVISSASLHYPLNVVYSPTSNKTYCTFYNGVLDSVLVVDGSTHQRIKAIPLHWATIPIWDSVTNRVYVSRLEENLVSVIDCRVDSVTAHIPVGAGPTGLDINTRRRRLYVENYDGSSVSIVDMVANRVLKTIPVPNYPATGCYSAAADKYYCGSWGRITVVDGRTDSVLARITLPQGTTTQAMVSVDDYGLVMASVEGANTDSVYVVDAAQDSIVAAYRAGGNPRSLAYSPYTGYVYCANGISRNITVLAGDGSGVVGTLAVGRGPYALVPVVALHRVYVGHLDCNRVYVIRDEAGGIAEGPVPGLATQGRRRALPCPFTSRVSIEFAVPGSGDATVFSADGRQVAILKRAAARNRGSVSVWDGRDQHGRRLPAGVYAVLVANGGTERVQVVKSD